MSHKLANILLEHVILNIRFKGFTCIFHFNIRSPQVKNKRTVFCFFPPPKNSAFFRWNLLQLSPAKWRTSWASESVFFGSLVEKYKVEGGTKSKAKPSPSLLRGWKKESPEEVVITCNMYVPHGHMYPSMGIFFNRTRANLTVFLPRTNVYTLNISTHSLFYPSLAMFTMSIRFHFRS